MTKTEIAALHNLSAEELVQGYVFEIKLSDHDADNTVDEMNEHGARANAYGDEIDLRGGLPSLVPLLDSPDLWVAYVIASRLARHESTSDRAMATLDRIADLRCGSASVSADIARNMIRYGDPLGAEWVGLP